MGHDRGHVQYRRHRLAVLPGVVLAGKLRRRLGAGGGAAALGRAGGSADAAPLPHGRGALAVLRSVIAKAPLHLVLIAIVLLWSIPTIALLVSSFREGSAISTSGWWNALTHPG